MVRPWCSAMPSEHSDTNRALNATARSARRWPVFLISGASSVSGTTNSWWPREHETATLGGSPILAATCCDAAFSRFRPCRRSQKVRMLGFCLIDQGDILSRFADTSRNSKEHDAHGRTSEARARFLSKVATMANVAPAPPGKLKESVQAKGPSAPKAAQAKPAVAQPAVAQPRPAVAQPRPAPQPKAAAPQPKAAAPQPKAAAPQPKALSLKRSPPLRRAGPQLRRRQLPPTRMNALRRSSSWETWLLKVSKGRSTCPASLTWSCGFARRSRNLK